MIEKYVDNLSYESQDDFVRNFKVKTPENFKYCYDIVDEWARRKPDKKVLCWTNDRGEHIDSTFAEIQEYSDRQASSFRHSGIRCRYIVILTPT